jgi:hypothetical protein
MHREPVTFTKSNSLYLVTCGIVHNDFKKAFDKIKVVGLGFVVVPGAITPSRNLCVMHFKVGVRKNTAIGSPAF